MIARFKPTGRQTGMLLLGLLAALLVVGPALHHASPTDQNLMATLQSPSAEHPAGTDQYGRDVLARIIHGGRLSLLASSCIVAGSLVLGFPIGLLAAGRGVLARAMTRLIDILVAFPSLILALAVVGALGIGILNLVLAFVIVGSPYYARLARGFAIERLRGLDIRAARAAGVGRWRVLWDHLLPHAVRSLAVAAGLDLGYTLASLAGFSYLGLGAQAPAAEWGLMLRDAQMYFTVAPWLLLGPSAGIALAVLGTILITEREWAGSFGR